MFGKPKKKSVGVGKARSQKEADKTDAGLEKMYPLHSFPKTEVGAGWTAPKKAALRGTKRVQKGMGDAASGIKTDAEKDEERRGK